MNQAIHKKIAWVWLNKKFVNVPLFLNKRQAWALVLSVFNKWAKPKKNKLFMDKLVNNRGMIKRKKSPGLDSLWAWEYKFLFFEKMVILDLNEFEI